MRLRLTIVGTIAILLIFGVGWWYRQTSRHDRTNQTEELVNRNYNLGYDEVQYFPMTDNYRKEIEELKEARRQAKHRAR